VYIALRERYRYIVFFETELYLRGRVEVDIPVVGCVDPWTDDEVYAAVGELENGDCGSGIVEDSFVGGEDLLDDVFCLFDVIFVRDTYDHIDPSCAVCSVVHYVIARELCVGDDDSDVVGSIENCIEDTDFLYGALCAGSLDEITDFEWPKDDHQEAGSEIRQCALECQADGQAGSAKDDGKLRGLYSYRGESCNHYKDQRRNVSEVLYELCDGFFDPGLEQGPFDDSCNNAGQPSSYEEDYYSTQDFEAVFAHVFRDCFQYIFHVKLLSKKCVFFVRFST